MINPRPSLPFVVMASKEPTSLEIPNMCFLKMQILGNRVTFSIGKGGPTSQLNLWRTGRRTFQVFEFIGPALVKKSWTLINAYPCKWEGPDLDATKNEVAIETLELVHEGIS